MNKYPLQRKGLAIAILFLLFGVLPPSDLGYKFTTENQKNQNQLRTLQFSNINNPPDLLLHKRCRVFGFGFVLYMDVINSSWHHIAYETNYSFRGFFYKANLLVTNQDDMQVHGYCLFIKDLNSGTTYNKKELPLDFYIYNFTGFIGLGYYYYPHGARGCGFYLFGNADDFQAYSP
jgi:hypothetical protein